jgi:osmotically-inducible protein OsmY
MKSLKTVVSDFDLCDAVEEELSWDPRVDVSRIRVAATDGAIALSGSVESYRQKAAAVRAAERIHGVKAVADDIQDVDASSIGVTASDDGVVRLHGTVASVAERRLAELAAESAPGVVKVVNDIDVSL